MIRLRRTVAVVISLVLVLVAVDGCSTGPQKPTYAETVVATTSIWADIVASVSCHRIPVHPVVPPGVDSHDFELSMRAADRMLRAKLIFANGLGLDADLHPMLERAVESGAYVVRLGEVSEPDVNGSDVNGSEGDPHTGEGDPHVWMDPENVNAVVPVIVEELKKLDLVDAQELDRCAQRYRDELAELMGEMSREMSDVTHSRRKLVSEHRNLGHFAQRFDFEVLGVMIDSSSALGEADPRHLERLRDAMRRTGVHTVFVQAGESEQAADAFVRDVSLEGEVVPLHIETIPPGGESGSGPGPSTTGGGYLAMMRTNARRVAAALSN